MQIRAMLISTTWFITATIGAAETHVNQGVDRFMFDDEKGFSHLISELAYFMCQPELGIGNVILTRDVKCTMGKGCTGKVSRQHVGYKSDMLITPNFDLLFSKSGFSTKQSKDIIASTTSLESGVKFVEINKEYGLAVEDAKDIAECFSAQVKSINTKYTLAESINSLDPEIQPQDPARYNIYSSELSRLEHAKYTITSPLTMNIGNTGLVTVTVVPSLRVRTQLPNISFTQPADLLGNSNSSRKLLDELPKFNVNGIDKKARTRDYAVESNGKDIVITYFEEIVSEGELVTVPLKHESLSVKLTSVGLSKIENVTPIKQVLVPFEPISWYWQIVPKIRGDVQLFVSLESTGSDGVIFSKNIPINVYVDWPIIERVYSFISSYWQWLAGTIFIPLIVLLWKPISGSLRKKNKEIPIIWVPPTHGKRKSPRRGDTRY